MDFIERIFGVSPDGGNGSLEFFWIVFLAVAAFLASLEYFRRKYRHSASEGFTSAVTASHQPADSERNLRG